MQNPFNRNKVAANYLDLTPHKTGRCSETKTESGEVVLLVENKGIFNTIAQKLFKKPRTTQIHLDGLGNFVWQHIDNKRSVNAIAKLVEEEFGDKAQPLYPRIVKYFQILESYEFVSMGGK